MSKITNPISFILNKCSQIHGYFVFWQFPRDVSIAIFYSQYIFVKSSFMVYVVLSTKLGKRPYSALLCCILEEHPGLVAMATRDAQPPHLQDVARLPGLVNSNA